MTEFRLEHARLHRAVEQRGDRVREGRICLVAGGEGVLADAAVGVFKVFDVVAVRELDVVALLVLDVREAQVGVIELAERVVAGGEDVGGEAEDAFLRLGQRVRALAGGVFERAAVERQHGIVHELLEMRLGHGEKFGIEPGGLALDLGITRGDAVAAACVLAVGEVFVGLQMRVGIQRFEAEPEGVAGLQAAFQCLGGVRQMAAARLMGGEQVVERTERLLPVRVGFVDLGEVPAGFRGEFTAEFRGVRL